MNNISGGSGGEVGSGSHHAPNCTTAACSERCPLRLLLAKVEAQVSSFSSVESKEYSFSVSASDGTDGGAGQGRRDEDGQLPRLRYREQGRSVEDGDATAAATATAQATAAAEELAETTAEAGLFLKRFVFFW